MDIEHRNTTSQALAASKVISQQGGVHSRARDKNLRRLVTSMTNNTVVSSRAAVNHLVDVGDYSYQYFRLFNSSACRRFVVKNPAIERWLRR